MICRIIIASKALKECEILKRVGVVFGGRSVEHEVSVITAMQIIENIDKTKYYPVPIYITKEGKWLTGGALSDFKTYKIGSFKDAKEIILSPYPNDFNLYLHPEKAGMFGKKIVDTVDIMFPALHGTYGEDGSIQGLFELMNMPYAGGGVLASSVGMDKILMKDVFKSHGIPVVDYTWFYRTEWENDQENLIKTLEEKISYPLFVKPANLGSSIGINKAKDREGLISAMEIAVNYDRKIIIEKAVEDPREINCAVLGYDNQLTASLCEEPLGWKDILSFEDKYISGNSKSIKGAGNGKRNIPADLEEDIRIKIEDLAKKSFSVIDAKGTSRIDFLMDKAGNIYVNEINTLPGSIAFYLWEGIGYSIDKLISKLIEIGFDTHKEKNKNMYSYDVDLFNRTQYGSKIKKV